MTNQYKNPTVKLRSRGILSIAISTLILSVVAVKPQSAKAENFVSKCLPAALLGFIRPRSLTIQQLLNASNSLFTPDKVKFVSLIASRFENPERDSDVIYELLQMDFKQTGEQNKTAFFSRLKGRVKVSFEFNRVNLVGTSRLYYKIWIYPSSLWKTYLVENPQEIVDWLSQKFQEAEDISTLFPFGVGFRRSAFHTRVEKDDSGQYFIGLTLPREGIQLPQTGYNLRLALRFVDFLNQMMDQDFVP